MKYSRVLLVNPNYPRSEFGMRHPPSGLGYLAESLKRAGIEYRVLDAGLRHSKPRLWQMIETFRPDVVGISMMTYMYRESYRLIDAIKRKWPEVSVAVGGPHISCQRRETLEACRGIDYGFVLEAEESFVEFCKGREPEEIGGILFRRNGKIIEISDHPFLSNLDAVPFPTYSGFELDKYSVKELVIVSSRGCPYRCIFCTAALAIGSRLRLRTPPNITDEIEYWYRRGYRQFTFADDNFTFQAERVEQICDEILARGLKGLKLRLGNGVRADKVSRHLLIRMRAAGFKHLAIGVEGGNNKILANLKKSETIECIESAIADACELGYDVTLFFLVGSPGETIEDIKDSIRLALKYPIFEAKFFNLIPYPKTELYRYVAENGLFTADPEGYLNEMTGTKVYGNPVFETPEMSAPDRRRALRMCEKVRKTILRRAIARKLGRVIGLRWLIAWIFSIGFVETSFRRGTVLRRLADRIALGK